MASWIRRKAARFLKKLRKLRQAATILNLSSLPRYNYDPKAPKTETTILSLKKPYNRKITIRKSNWVDRAVIEDVFLKKYHIPFTPLSGKPTILDLGSNIGLTVLDYKTKYPDAKIIGVEMDRGNFELAKKNTNNLKDVEIVWGAIWYEDGKVSYRDDLNTDAYSAEVGRSEGGNLIEVNSYTIDSICAEYNLDVVDFLKMDIEGAEVEIFARPMKWLSKVRSFNIEFHRVDRERYIEMLTTNGFICDKHPTHKNGIIGYRP